MPSIHSQNKSFDNQKQPGCKMWHGHTPCIVYQLILTRDS